jgi:hypothetical protein
MPVICQSRDCCVLKDTAPVEHVLAGLIESISDGELDSENPLVKLIFVRDMVLRGAHPDELADFGVFGLDRHQGYDAAASTGSGPSFRTLFTSVDTWVALSARSQPGTRSRAASFPLSGSLANHTSHVSGGSTSGIRLCTVAASLFGSVVMIVQGHEERVLGVAPDLPQSADGDRSPISGVDVEGLLRVLLRLASTPLVVAIGWEQAAPTGGRPSESVGLGEALSPGVDHLVADRRVFGPGRHQAPHQLVQLSLAVAVGAHREDLRLGATFQEGWKSSTLVSWIAKAFTMSAMGVLAE